MVLFTGEKSLRSPNAPQTTPSTAETQNKNEAEQIELDRWPTASCFHLLRTFFFTKSPAAAECFRHPRAALEWIGEVEGATCLEDFMTHLQLEELFLISKWIPRL